MDITTSAPHPIKSTEHKEQIIDKNMTMQAPESPLWSPSQAGIEESRLYHYMNWLAKVKNQHFSDYNALWDWSVTDLEGFWESIWQYFDIKSSAPYQGVLNERRMPGAVWFEGARLNFAEQLFRTDRHVSDSKAIAIVAESEVRPLLELSWAELYRQVTTLATKLRAMGVQPGDRVVAYMPNIPETVVAFYACASVGAIWSCCSPDMGTASVVDRFRQIEPKVLIAADGYRYGGQDFDRLATLDAIRSSLPSLEQVILLPYLDLTAEVAGTISWHSVVNCPATSDRPFEFEQLPFDHPLWIVYSSGTTGMPKAIVHGQGGVLVEHLKANALHLDLGANDRFHWFSTTGWIMWNNQITGLLVGAAICLFDGSPGYPNLDTLWKFAERAQVTVFGAGAAYYAHCMRSGMHPAAVAAIHRIRTLGSTGSPLDNEVYHWIYKNISADALLATICGGTDVAAAFVGACPIAPLYAGEMQCRCLGVAAYAFDEKGARLTNEVGELVVTEPMPSMPLYFWNDEGNRRYDESYFETFPGVWRHGDWIRITSRGGAIVYGRSDTTINRFGIRMGTAEIYRVVERIEEIVDSLVVDLEYLGRESYMPLFVVLGEGHVLDESLKRRINDQIRLQLSSRHTPSEILAVQQIPRTLTGKKMELPVKKILLGMSADNIVNRDAMANPSSLDYFFTLSEQIASRQTRL